MLKWLSAYEFSLCPCSIERTRVNLLVRGMDDKSFFHKYLMATRQGDATSLKAYLSQ